MCWFAGDATKTRSLLRKNAVELDFTLACGNRRLSKPNAFAKVEVDLVVFYCSQLLKLTFTVSQCQRNYLIISIFNRQRGTVFIQRVHKTRFVSPRTQ